MRRYVLLIACLLGGGARDALASPIQDRVTLMGVPPYSQGLEAEIGLCNSPFRLGGQFIYLWSGRATTQWAPFTPQAGGRQQWNAWVGYRQPLSPDASIGVIGGTHQSWEEGISVTVPVIRHESAGIVGLSYEQAWGSVRLRLRPTLLLNPQDWRYIPWFGVLAKSAMLSGIPWVEVGYRITPGLELGLRASLTPLALAVSF